MNQQKQGEIFINSFKSVKNHIYFEFIALNAVTVRDSCYCNYETHIHHIIPKYWFNDYPQYKKFQNCKENLVILKQEDHITAHKILFQIYNDPRDQGAVFLLQHNYPNAITLYRQAGAYVTHCKLKLHKKNFWNSEQQKKKCG